jgi:hypothetical protein
MNFRGASLASAIALIFLAAGCGGSGNGAPLPAPEKADIVVDAFPAIDSAGLYIAQMDHLFAAQGLNVTIETAQTTQTEIDGQVQGRYDITTGDYVTYINNELAQGQEIADTDRTAVELALGQYLQIPRQTAAFLSLPSFPTGVDPARLQRVVSAMLRFGLLPPSDDAFRITSMTGA